MERLKIRWIVFAVFLLTAAAQDFKRQQVKLWVYILFGLLALIWDGYLWRTADVGFSWNRHLASCSIGICLYLAGRLLEGGIGAGDGLFFLISGLMLDFSENLAVMCMGVMLCGLYGMVLFVWNQIYWKKNVRKLSIPFLPFAAIPGIWMAGMELWR